MKINELQQLFTALPGPYTLTIGRDYTPAMDTPRRQAFPEANHNGTNRDVYDDRAWYLTVHLAGKLAAYSRLIPGPDGFFKALTAHPLLVDSTAAADWSRLVIPAPFRALGLPELMGRAAILVAQALGCQYVHGAANPSRQLIRLLHQLVFQAVDSPLNVSVQPGISFPLQLFTCNLNTLSYPSEAQLVSSWRELIVPAVAQANNIVP